ncbi:hypothetical protein GJAV_G00140760 [Gymnothorax javanicus]|nr:hypothetical protein GJAV_G00140760 [Gymnothorax javanicus]
MGPGPHPNLVHGVAAVFASYYVFSLEYPVYGSCTMEFLQRCFLGINPERGSKSKKRHNGCIDAQASTPHRKLVGFEWSTSSK